MRLQFLRLKAFTILELLVVLVVSSLLFSMAYAALRAVQRQQHHIELKSALLGQVSSWQTALTADLAAGTVVQVASDRITCQRPNGPIVYIYSYPDSTLVREQGELVDTFPVPVRVCAYFWQGQLRTEGLIDEISLFGVAARDTFYLQARARYAAQQLVSPLPILPSTPAP